MATDQTKRRLLAVLVVVLGIALYWSWSSTAVPPAATSNTGGAPARSARGAAPAGITAPDVHLRALKEDRPKPDDGGRNLFRFRPKAAPAPVAPPPPPGAAAPQARGPAGPPPPPPIPLKFAGIVEAPERSKRYAALVDATGHTFLGSEGDVVAGQYRLVKIGAESVEMSYLDGRGRQTIRLNGS
jgi:hypothetical protein